MKKQFTYDPKVLVEMAQEYLEAEREYQEFIRTHKNEYGALQLLSTEENVNFLFEIENFKNALRKAVSDKVLRKNQRLIIFVEDSLGDNYYCKTKALICQIAK